VVLDCVREAESRISGKQFMEYLPTNGNKDFVKHSIKLAYGEDSKEVAAGTIAAIQTLSGTGSCRLMADFMHRFTPGAKVYIPVPTWSNHHNIWRDAGCEERTFRYYKPETRGLDFEGLLEDINGAEENSVILLHACAHNPTGVDPSPEQWRQISKAIKERGLFPFFDMAYQGFASGDCERDAAALRIFVQDGHKVGCSQSFAKNMGLYGQRIGCFSIMCADTDEATRVESQMKLLARAMYSNPPLHGAAIVTAILGDDALKKQWYAEVKAMADRIINMRGALRAALEATGSELPWNHVTEQIGMFCFSGMTGTQVDRLRVDHHIYLTRDGRISMAGVTTGTVARLAEAMHDVTTTSGASKM
jgi:aspartate aminotransferase